jgi:hypothetical protein
LRTRVVIVFAIRSQKRYSHGVRRVAAKLLAAGLLAICLGIHALEVSGRWDQTLADANDEAALVAIVLCVGMSISAAAMLLAPVRPSRIVLETLAVVDSALHHDVARIVPSLWTTGPPISLRI